MNKKVKTVLKVYGIATTVQQAIAFGLKFGFGNHKDSVFTIGEYTVNVKTRPLDMGLNMVAQTDSLFFGTAYVTVDGLFWVLPKDVQKCILAHELGHMVLDNGMPKDMAKYAITRQCGICPKEEKIADSYSVKLYGKKATKKMLKFLAMITPSVEIVQRIAAI